MQRRLSRLAASCTPSDTTDSPEDSRRTIERLPYRRRKKRGRAYSNSLAATLSLVIILSFLVLPLFLVREESYLTIFATEDHAIAGSDSRRLSHGRKESVTKNLTKGEYHANFERDTRKVLQEKILLRAAESSTDPQNKIRLSETDLNNEPVSAFVQQHLSSHQHHIGKPMKPSPMSKCTIEQIAIQDFTMDETVVPFVYMVYDRVDYLRQAIESLRQSDFPSPTVPLIISHDGRVPEVVKYVESLQKKGYFHVIQIFHPYSCYEHPLSFPGDDKRLNEGFEGDIYGNPRDWSVTCCKHHFTWLMKTVFDMHFGNQVIENFMFLEEDYLVAPTVYSTILQGLNAIKQFEHKTDERFFGVGLDVGVRQRAFDYFSLEPFTTGPMTMSRSVFTQLQEHAADYCRIDDYNWDWSMVQAASMGRIPHTLLVPGRPQVRHIGAIGGMHSAHFTNKQRREALRTDPFTTRFAGKKVYYCGHSEALKHEKLFGGWAHPRDQEHCLEVLGGS